MTRSLLTTINPIPASAISTLTVPAPYPTQRPRLVHDQCAERSDPG
ncbi:MAG: hypothetical protein L0Y54_03730 [Sporichthyaceae bacterium]|nr:hypothetical protein [Sporichthyaceae bacterium]